MELEHYDSEKLKSNIINIIEKYLNLNETKIFFFGSRVSKTNNERSDIDIGLEAPNPIDIITLSKIKADLEEIPMLYKIDLIDFRQTSSNFNKIALEHIEIINNPKNDQN